MSRPHSMNQQIFKGQKQEKVKPKDFFAIEGQMDLSRPDNINQQTFELTKSPNMKPKDNLGLEGDFHLPQQQIYAKGQKANINVPKSNLSLETAGSMDITKRELATYTRSGKVAPNSFRPKDNLGLNGLLDFSGKEHQDERKGDEREMRACIFTRKASSSNKECLYLKHWTSCTVVPFVPVVTS